MSTAYDIHIPGTLPTIADDTNGAVTIASYPGVKYRRTMCLVVYKGTEFEACRNGAYLTSIIYRYQGDINGLLRKLRRSYPKGTVQIKCVG